MKSNQDGFSIPELLVVIIITSLFVSLILSFTFGYWKYGYLLESDQDTFITRLDAGDLLREQVGTSAGLIIQNSIPDTHSNNPDPTNGTNLYWIPLHAVPGTKAVPSSGTTPLIYFRRFSVTNSGQYIMNGTAPYEDEYVLYLTSGKQLLLRKLANPSAPGNALKTTCPPANATMLCPADKVVANDLASVGLRYFSRSGNTIDWTSITDPNTGQYIGPDFPAVEVVEFTLNLTRKPIFQQTNATINSTIIRIALRND